jgi:hypothetical protein
MFACASFVCVIDGSFGLVTARRTYYLQADSEAEMKSWMSALKTAIAGVRDNAHDEVVDGKPMVNFSYRQC